MPPLPPDARLSLASSSAALPAAHPLDAEPQAQSDWQRLVSSFVNIESRPRIPVLQAERGARRVQLPADDWGCIGRQTLLATLQTSLQIVRDHHVPHTLALCGAQGAGKTCVAEHFIAGLDSAPFALLHMSAARGFLGEGLAHLPGRLMARVLGLQANLPVEACLEQVARLLQHHRLPVPDAAGRSVYLHALDQGTAHAALPARAVVRQRLLAVLPALLAAMCRQSVLVLWIDDFDHFDLDDQRWLMSLLGQLTKRRIFVVLAAGAEDGLQAEGWRGIGFVFRAERVEGLAERAFDALVHRALAPLGAGDVPERVMRWLTSQGDTTPGRLRANLQRLIDAGLLLPPDGGVSWRWRPSQDVSVPQSGALSTAEGTRSQPPSLEMLTAHLDDLTPESLHVLRLAALMRDPFLLEDLLALLRLHHLPDEQPWFDDPRPPWLQQQVRELIERGLLRRAEDRADRADSADGADGADSANDTRITWALTRVDLGPVVLKGMDAALQRAAHACLSRVLSLRQAPVAAVAHHLSGAGLGKQAATLWLQQAREIPSGTPLQQAFTLSLQLQTQALPHLGPEDGELYLGALSAHGVLLRVCGRAGEALPLFVKQLQVAFAFHYHYASLEAYYYHAACLLDLGLYPDAKLAFERSIDLSERPDFALCDPVLVLSAKASHGASVLACAQPRACAESLKLIEPHAERLKALAPHSQAALEALLTLAQIRMARAELHQAAATLDEALALASSPPHPTAPTARLHQQALRCRLLSAAGGVSLALGQHTSASARLKQASDLARTLGVASVRSVVLSAAADLSVSLGDYAHALHNLRRAHEMSSTVRDPAVRCEMQCKIARAHAYADQFEEALKHCDRALQLARKSPGRLAQARAFRTRAAILTRLARSKAPAATPLEIRDLFLQSLAITEDMGHWLDTALCLDAYAAFLSDHDKTADAQRCTSRARALAPDLKPPKVL